jgi:hypothetical protein
VKGKLNQRAKWYVQYLAPPFFNRLAATQADMKAPITKACMIGKLLKSFQFLKSGRKTTLFVSAVLISLTRDINQLTVITLLAFFSQQQNLVRKQLVKSDLHGMYRQ